MLRQFAHGRRGAPDAAADEAAFETLLRMVEAIVLAP
jgi:hypothetical protein